MKPWILWLLPLCLSLIVPSLRAAFEDLIEPCERAETREVIAQPAPSPAN